jgi:hypothetical protein
MVWLFPPFTPLGVGSKEPEAFAAVRKSGGVRSHNTPSRIIPHFGKITEDHGKTSLNKQG